MGSKGIMYIRFRSYFGFGGCSFVGARSRSHRDLSPLQGAGLSSLSHACLVLLPSKVQNQRGDDRASHKRGGEIERERAIIKRRESLPEKTHGKKRYASNSFARTPQTPQRGIALA